MDTHTRTQQPQQNCKPPLVVHTDIKLFKRRLHLRCSTVRKRVVPVKYTSKSEKLFPHSISRLFCCSILLPRSPLSCSNAAARAAGHSGLSVWRALTIDCSFA